MAATDAQRNRIRPTVYASPRTPGPARPPSRGTGLGSAGGQHRRQGRCAPTGDGDRAGQHPHQQPADEGEGRGHRAPRTPSRSRGRRPAPASTARTDAALRTHRERTPRGPPQRSARRTRPRPARPTPPSQATRAWLMTTKVSPAITSTPATASHFCSDRSSPNCPRPATSTAWTAITAAPGSSDASDQQGRRLRRAQQPGTDRLHDGVDRQRTQPQGEDQHEADPAEVRVREAVQVAGVDRRRDHGGEVLAGPSWSSWASCPCPRRCRRPSSACRRPAWCCRCARRSALRRTCRCRWRAGLSRQRASRCRRRGRGCRQRACPCRRPASCRRP